MRGECVGVKFLGTDLELEQAYMSMVQAVQISSDLETKIGEATKNDDKYRSAVMAVKRSWPTSDREATGEYWSHRMDLVEEQNLLYYQGRLVIPVEARTRILESLHRGHVGQNAAMRRAEKAVWWPGWTRDIKEYGRRCGQCQVMQPAQRKEPMMSFETPQAPGLVWHSDYLSWMGHEYVFFADGFSGWTEVYTAKSRTPAALIRATRMQIMRQGVPRKIHADQGTAYHSAEFSEFCKKWGIRLVLSSPKHPQGNAIAEATVKKIKHVFKGAQNEDEMIRAVLAMNQTPVASGRPSPAEIHFGRNLRDELHEKVCQSTGDWKEVKEWKEAKKRESKENYDKKTRDLDELQSGDLVRVWHNERWWEARVRARIEERPRSYRLELEDGRLLERNRVQIRRRRTDELPKNERKVSPLMIFQQAFPPLEPALQRRLMIIPETNRTDPCPPPDNENARSILRNSTSDTDTGESTSPTPAPATTNQAPTTTPTSPRISPDGRTLSPSRIPPDARILSPPRIPPDARIPGTTRDRDEPQTEEPNRRPQTKKKVKPPQPPSVEAQPTETSGGRQVKPRKRLIEEM